MLHFTQEDAQMLNHTVDVIGDRIRSEGGYTPQDEATVVKLDQLAKTKGSALVLTGDALKGAEARDMLRDVVLLELRHWVPGASQRLIYRAGNALGLKQPWPMADDHGPDAGAHALVADYVAGLYLLRCVTCCRLFHHDAAGAKRLA